MTPEKADGLIWFMIFSAIPASLMTDLTRAGCPDQKAILSLAEAVSGMAST